MYTLTSEQNEHSFGGKQLHFTASNARIAENWTTDGCHLFWS